MELITIHFTLPTEITSTNPLHVPIVLVVWSSTLNAHAGVVIWHSWRGPALTRGMDEHIIYYKTSNVKTANDCFGCVKFEFLRYSYSTQVHILQGTYRFKTKPLSCTKYILGTCPLTPPSPTEPSYCLFGGRNRRYLYIIISYGRRIYTSIERPRNSEHTLVVWINIVSMP